MTLARSYLWTLLVASVVFGAAYLFAPARVTEMMGIAHETPAGLTDLRATYAGFQLGMAGLLGWCLRESSRLRAGLQAIAWVIGGVASCRLLGLFVDGPSPEMLAATVIEVSLVGVAVLALSRLPADTAATLR